MRSYLLANKPNEAIAFLNSVTPANPNNAEARLLLGSCSLPRGMSPPPRKPSRRSSPEAQGPVADINLANLHMRAKQVADAEQVIQQGLAAVPNDSR